MTTPAIAIKGKTFAQPRSVDVLHWLFIRGTRLLSCDLIVRGYHRYELQITPLWNEESPATEMFDRPADALRRHAEVAFLLRESGWLLADRELARRAA